MKNGNRQARIAVAVVFGVISLAGIGILRAAEPEWFGGLSQTADIQEAAAFWAFDDLDVP